LCTWLPSLQEYLGFGFEEKGNQITKICSCSEEGWDYYWAFAMKNILSLHTFSEKRKYIL